MNDNIGKTRVVKIGDIYWVDFNGTGSEQKGRRPALIVQNDMGNKYSPTLKVIPITTKTKKPSPTHVNVPIGNGLKQESTLLCEQETVCDRSKLGDYIGTLTDNKNILKQTAIAMAISTPLIKYMGQEELLNLQKKLSSQDSYNRSRYTTNPIFNTDSFSLHNSCNRVTVPC